MKVISMMMAAQPQSTNSTNGSRASNLDAASSSSNTTGAATGQGSKGAPVQEYLTNCKSLYSCIYCRTHLADHDELVSRSFQGNHGRAYLFNSVVNVSCGQAVQRDLNTGPHAVADIYCSNCHTTLGWKYEKAYVETQKYKEGKYIIELAHVVRENRHLEFDKGELLLERSRRNCRNQGHMYSSGLWQGSTSSGNHNRRSLQCGTNNNNNNHDHNHINPRSSLTPSTVSGARLMSSSLTANGSSSMGRLVASPGGGDHRYDYNHDDVHGDDNDDDDDEDLMFPFYDDMCSNRSSYPCSFSSSQHNRMRRSLYLDSTPYDWKYATSASSAISGSAAAAASATADDNNSNAEASTSSSSSSGYTSSGFDRSKGQPAPKLKSTTSQPAAAKGYLASSPDDSGLSDLSAPSPTSSMSPDASPEQNQMSYHSDNKNRNKLNGNNNKYEASGRGGSISGSTSTSRDNSEHRELETYNNDDMQFKFEADTPELQVNNNNNNGGNSNRATREQINKHCDQSNSGTEIVGCETERHPPVVAVDVDVEAIGSNSSNNNDNNNNNNNNLSENGHEGSRDQEQPSSPPRVGQSSMDETDDSNSGNSISLEDEEFYDCYTGHEVSNMMVESGSTSTLKIVE